MRARPVLPLRYRRQRQGQVRQYPGRHLGRLRRHRATEVLMESRAIGTRPSWPSARRPPRHRHRNRTGPPLGRNRIKALTGGDPDHRTLHAPGLLRLHRSSSWISGNHKPSLRSVDEAIRRRMHLIPFTVTIPRTNATNNYPKNESRMARHPRMGRPGCRDWQAHGLQPPQPSSPQPKPTSTPKTPSPLRSKIAASKIPTPGPLEPELFKSWSDWATTNSEFVRTYQLPRRPKPVASNPQSGAVPTASRGLTLKTIIGTIM